VRLVVVLCALAISGCGFAVNDVRCRADADCSGGTLCIGGFCEPPVDRPPPPPDDGGPAPDDGGPAPDAGLDPIEVELTAVPTTALIGESVTLSWTSTGGDCTLDGEPVDNDDTLVIGQPVPQRHTLVCARGEETAQDSVDVEVVCGDITDVPQPPEAVRSQADIEALLNGVTGCFRVQGSLSVAQSDLQDLGPLYGLVEVLGDFNVDDNPALTSLRGVGLLESITNRLNIGGNLGNDLLVDLRGLEGLTTVGNNLQVQDNLRLESLRGFENLEEVNGTVNVIGNLNLLTLEPLADLSMRGFQIRDNPEIDDLEPIATWSTERTDIDVRIRNTPRLTSLEPLAWITSVDFVEIENLDRLEDLDGLENIATAFEVEVIGNDSLTDMSALAGLAGDLGCFRVEGNESLAVVEGPDNINMVIDQGCQELTVNNNALGFVVTGFAGVTTVDRLEVFGASEASFPNLATGDVIFVDNYAQSSAADIFPSLATARQLRLQDFDLATTLTLPTAAVTSLFIENSNLLEGIDVNGLSATCWTQSGNALLLQAEIDRVGGLIGLVQGSCP
jgi:hypothetical protein